MFSPPLLAFIDLRFRDGEQFRCEVVKACSRVPVIGSFFPSGKEFFFCHGVS